MPRPPYIWLQQPHPRPKWLILAGVASLSYALLLCLLSHRTELGDSALAGRVHYWLAGSGIAAGGLFIAALWLAGPAHLSRRALGTLLVVGLAARIIISTQPMLLEADYWRYLWDGAVVAHGYSPYTYAPSAVLHAAPEVPRELFDLGRRADPVLENIHHGHLTTIYPPVAQGIFAAAWWLRPFDPDGLRIMFFLFDIGAVLLLLRLLHALALPSAWIAWYWLNPLLLRMPPWKCCARPTASRGPRAMEAITSSGSPTVHPRPRGQGSSQVSRGARPMYSGRHSRTRRHSA